MKTYQNNIIEGGIANAASNFEITLDRIYPAFGNNAFNERNLTFQVAHAFLKRPQSNAIMEIPSWNKKNKKHDHRIDAYLCDNKVGILIESKRLNNLPQAKGVCKDLRRMNHDDLNDVIKKITC